MLLFLLIALTPFKADKVEIFSEGNERIVHLIGNVVIEGSETMITCAEAKFSEVSGWVRLFRDVRLRDSNGEVYAHSAIYYFNENRGYLSDSVRIITSDERIRADSLYYDGGRDSVEMYGNVLIEDERNDMSIAGERGWYNLTRDEGVLYGNPQLQMSRQGKEPMIVVAESFRLLTGENLFYGFDSVRAIIDSVVVLCDTVNYDLETETGNMVGPIIREKDNELRGVRGQFRLRNKEIESMSVEDGHSVYYTKEGSKNIVEGKTISIMFQEGKAVIIKVEGEPRGVLSLKRSQESAVD